MKQVEVRAFARSWDAGWLIPTGLFLVVLLSGCNSSDGALDENEVLHDGPGLIQTPDFGAGGEYLLRPWSFSQHAGETSYEYEIEGATLWIRRIGVEPWGKLGQRIPAYEVEDASALKFVVETRASLTEEWGEAFEPTGPGISIWGYSETTERSIMGPQLLVNERVSLEPGQSSQGWERQVVCVEMPEAVTRLEVWVVMSLGGELAIRRPGLYAVALDECAYEP